MKTCSKCHTEKPRSEYWKSSRASDGLQGRCKACCNARTHALRKEARKYGLPDDDPRHGSNNGYLNFGCRCDGCSQAHATAKRKSSYGLTAEQEATFTNAVICEICLKEMTTGNRKNPTRKVVDHCHDTGNFRGVICAKCNLGLGHFEDDVDRMKRAIHYVAKHAGCADV